MNVYVFGGDAGPIPNSLTWQKDHLIKLIYATSDCHAHSFFSATKPDVFITIGPENTCHTDFPVLWKLPLYLRRRWLHKANKKDIEPWQIKSCFADVINENLGPRISVFTTAFESGDRIERAHESLLEQTCQEWEWVIVDDSNTMKTWNDQLTKICEKDCRVRIFRGRCNDGFIGSVKRDVARMCRGEFLVEFDHDDELIDTALDDLIHAFESDASVAFVGSDCIELYEGSLKNWDYGSIYGFGFHSYYKQFSEGRWVHVARNGPLNKFTIRHIVGVLNHVRAWRRSAYDELGGHDPNLNVADDYDLILRTFCSPKKYRLARLPKYLYKQYRTNNGSNFTILRNAYIQWLVALLRDKYEEAIHQRLLELGLDDDGVYNEEIHSPGQNAFMSWHHDLTADLVLDPDPDRIAIVMPTFSSEQYLIDAMKSVVAQTFPNWQLYIIGDKSPVLDHVMQREKWTHNDRFRYWNLYENCGQGSFPRNYALKTLTVGKKYIAYLDDKNTWKPNHLESLFKALTTSENNATFAFSSFESDGFRVLCSEPKKYRIDTSCLLHKSELLAKYGYWRCNKEYGYAIDWDLVQRWVQGKEPWVATKLFTLNYINMHQNMQGVYHAYDDQPQSIPKEEIVTLHVPTQQPNEHKDEEEEQKETAVYELCDGVIKCSITDKHGNVTLKQFQHVIKHLPIVLQSFQKVIDEDPVSVTTYPKSSSNKQQEDDVD